MDLTRRRLALAAAAMPAAWPALAATRPRKPLIIAHRGASGERPEHTLMAYRLAIAEGCDFIEPDLVPTKDGHLVVRHESEISGTTDVAKRSEFAARRTTKVVEGKSLTGWFTEDFTLAELKTLRARERLPELRRANTRFDGMEPIPTYQEVVDLAKAESRRTGRTIGTYPEMKHPSYFASIGLPLEKRLHAALKANGLDSASAPVIVQCFEVGALKTFRGLSSARLIQLMDSGKGPADLPQLSYREMASPEGLKQVAAYADGIGPEWALVLPTAPDGGLALASSLVADAHAARLAVHPYTVRAENHFLPPALRRGTDPGAHGNLAAVCKALYAAGIDGLFSDFPGVAAAARG